MGNDVSETTVVARRRGDRARRSAHLINELAQLAAVTAGEGLVVVVREYGDTWVAGRVIPFEAFAGDGVVGDAIFYQPVHRRRGAAFESVGENRIDDGRLQRYVVEINGTESAAVVEERNAIILSGEIHRRRGEINDDLFPRASAAATRRIGADVAARYLVVVRARVLLQNHLQRVALRGAAEEPENELRICAGVEHGGRGEFDRIETCRVECDRLVARMQLCCRGEIDGACVVRVGKILESVFQRIVVHDKALRRRWSKHDGQQDARNKFHPARRNGHDWPLRHFAVRSLAPGAAKP